MGVHPGACIRGTEYKDSTVSRKVAQGLKDWQDCQALCASDASCHTFDFVGEQIGDQLSSTGVQNTGDCWFRLDDAFDLKLGTFNHTSGHLVDAPSPAPPGAKNVLFIMFDDLRAMHKAYGWSQPHMPNQEKFAAESLIFDRAFVQQAVCGPSRASFMSGRRPDRTQMYNFLNGPEPGGFRNAPGAVDWNTFPQWFKSHGYCVAGAGKLFHTGDPSHNDPPSWTEERCLTDFPMFGQGRCPVPKDVLKNMDDAPACPVDRDVYKNCSSDVMCFPDESSLEAGLQFLNKASVQYKETGQPFWLGMGFVKPHTPHIYPKEFLDNVPSFDDMEVAPNSYFPVNAPEIAHHVHSPSKAIDQPASESAAKMERRGYYAAAAYSDFLLGTLLDEVDRLGLRDDTLVVMGSDHGWGLGEHNHWIKYTNWETDVRVPLFVRAPWKPNAMGQRTSAIVEQIDIYPTAAELAGIAVNKSEESIDGSSWAHLLDDPTATHLSEALAQYPRCWPEGMEGDSAAFPDMARCTSVEKENIAYMGYTLRTKDWRYTEWPEWDGANLRPNWNNLAGYELYDHRNDDPSDSKVSFEEFENENVADAHADKVSELRTRLRDLVAKTNPNTMLV